MLLTIASRSDHLLLLHALTSLRRRGGKVLSETQTHNFLKQSYSYTHIQTHSTYAHNEDSAIALNNGDTCFVTTFKIQNFQIENDAR